MKVRCLLACAAACACVAACDPAGRRVPGADAARGRALLASYGCVACHRIQGMAPSGSLVGPPLEHIAGASYVGGVLPNTTEGMVRWIMHPRQASPGTAMPELGVSEGEARDMAAYLYSQ
ncbi:c-type cytochrome [Oxalobacteraceae bacterium A2-2]